MYFTLQADAQTFADKIHAQMISTNPAYAKSATDGQTLRWAIPRQDIDEKTGLPTSDWFVTVKDRVLPVLTAAEVTKLSPVLTADPPKG